MSLKLKRMVRILIPVAILAAVVAVLLAVGGKNTVSDGFCFTRLDDGTYGVRLVRAPDNEDVVIPAEFKGKRVSRILSDFAAYTGRTYGVERKMYKLTVPDSVKVIEDNAFKGWQWLDSVVLPASEITLGEYAFAGSELREIVFPEGITVSLIPEGAFMDCERLAYIEIPDSVTEIGDRAFEDCGFTGELSLEDTFIQRIGGRAFRDCKQLYKVTLPKSLISLEADAFKGCARLIQVTDLSDVRVTDGSKDRLPDSVRLVNYLKDDRFTTDDYGYVFWRGEQFPFLVGVVEKALSVGGKIILPSGFEGENYYIADYAFEGKAEGELSVPKAVLGLGKYCFSECEITHLSFSGEIKEIPEGAFYQCENLESVDFPNSLEEIGAHAFVDCTKLISLKFTANSRLKRIGEGAFKTVIGGISEVKSFELPRSVESVGKWAFNRSWLCARFPEEGNLSVIGEGAFEGMLFPKGARELCIPAYVTEIEKNAFRMAQVSTLSFEEGCGIKEIPEGAFSNCYLGSVSFDGITLERIGDRAFYSCGLSRLELPETLVSIGEQAFSGCGIEYIIVPEGVESIGARAFNGCSRLQSAYLPSTLTEIGEGVFGNCSAMYYISMEKGNENYYAERGALYSKKNNALIAYSFNTEDKKFETAEGTVEIGRGAFGSAGKLKRVTIGKDIRAIGKEAFPYSIEEVVFTETEGWVVTSGVFSFRMDPEVLADPVQAANLLIAYRSFDWSRE